MIGSEEIVSNYSSGGLDCTPGRDSSQRRWLGIGWNPQGNGGAPSLEAVMRCVKVALRELVLLQDSVGQDMIELDLEGLLQPK